MIYLGHYLNDSTPGYGGSKDDFSSKKLSCMEHGGTSNSLRIELKNHVGTHIDFPLHFDPKGKSLSDYPSEFWQFDSVQLIDLPCEEGRMISPQDLKNLKKESDFLLLRTGFEKKRMEESYWARNPGFLPETGLWIREKFPKLRVIGFDFISLTSYLNRPLGREAHKAFLGPHKSTEPVLILEDMKLSELKKAPVKIIVAPLLIERADGVPVTVLAL